MKKIFYPTLLVLLCLTASPREGGRNFLLVTIDTWRADYISASGMGKVATPFLDKLAGEGRYIKFAESTCPMTTPAHASILTGLYPNRHGIRDNRNFSLDGGAVTLAQLFKQRGYLTAAVVSGKPLQKRYGLDRGFDQYDDREMDEEGKTDRLLKGSLKTGREAAVLALSISEKAKGDLFLWLHMYDPHFPYNPPREFSRKYPRDLYAGEVSYVDAVLADFMPRLLASKEGRWTVIIAGDHGEALGDHGEQRHGILLYASTRTVPLICWDSRERIRPFGNGVKSLIDIFPSAQEIFGLPPSKCDGVSLFNDTKDRRSLFSETFFPLCFAANPGYSVRTDSQVFIKHGSSSEVYADGFPEGRNLSAERREFALRSRELLKKYSSEGGRLTPNLRLTAEEQRALASLGYIGSFSGDTDKITTCDLRDLAADFTAYYERGDEMTNKGNLNILLAEFDRLLKKYPFSPMLHCDKSKMLIEMRRYEQAEEECKVCLMLDQANATACSNLANLKAMKGKFAEAEKYYLLSLSRDEGSAIAHLNLGLIYFEKMNKNREAAEHLKRFLELAPEHQRASEVKEVLRKIDNAGK